MQLLECGYLRAGTHGRGTGEAAAYLLDFLVDLCSQLRRRRGDVQIAEDDGCCTQTQLAARFGDEKHPERSYTESSEANPSIFKSLRSNWTCRPSVQSSSHLCERLFRCVS